MRAFALACLLAGSFAAPAHAADAATVAKDAPRLDGSSAEAFAESRAAFEAEMGDAARFAFHMRLVEVRNKLTDQRGPNLSDTEFAAALDGKTLAEVEAMAEAAPMHITIDIESSDDT